MFSSLPGKYHARAGGRVSVIPFRLTENKLIGLGFLQAKDNERVGEGFEGSNVAIQR